MPRFSQSRYHRSGRLPLARLLSLLSLCLLIFLIAWQIWLRVSTREDQSAGQLPAISDEANTSSQTARSEDAGDNIAFIDRDNSTDQIAAAATLLSLGAQGSTAALSELAIMKAGHEAHLWVLSDVESAVPLRARFLRGITDSQAVASGLGKTREDSMEFAAYIEALNKAALTPAYAFANSARHDATYAHLMSDPNDYRGDIVHIEGRLKRVRRFNPPIAADNLRDLYEGWIFVRDQGADPACLIFTELPEGLEVADKMQAKVAFNGYFFKRYRFKAADSGPNQAREAPLLIGRTVVLLEKPVTATATDSGAGSSSLLLGFMTLVVLTIVLAVGLTWWFRRSDRHVRSRLAEAMARDFEGPAMDQTPLPQQALPPSRLTLDPNDPKDH